MKNNEPEVVAYVDLHQGHGRRYVSLRRGVDHYTLSDGDRLIRLSDYERMQADRDQQYNMKVKAREQRDAVTAKLKALQAECEQLGKELAETELRALKFIHQCNAHVELYQELRVERDQLQTDCEKLRKASSELANWCFHEVGVDIELTPGLRQVMDITGVVYDEE